MVDDNKMLQTIFKKYLDKLGVKCIIAENGMEAIELFKKQSFSIIFMDLHMPGMDGTYFLNDLPLTSSRFYRRISHT